MKAFSTLSASAPVEFRLRVQELAKKKGISERKLVLIALEAYLKEYEGNGTNNSGNNQDSGTSDTEHNSSPVNQARD